MKNLFLASMNIMILLTLMTACKPEPSPLPDSAWNIENESTPSPTLPVDLTPSPIVTDQNAITDTEKTSAPAEPEVTPQTNYLPFLAGELTPAPASTDDLSAKLRTILAVKLNIPAEQMKLVEIKEKMWPNSCLGMAAEDEMCLDVITPGYAITFDTPDGQLLIHTNKAGTTYRVWMAEADGE